MKEFESRAGLKHGLVVAMAFAALSFASCGDDSGASSAKDDCTVKGCDVGQVCNQDTKKCEAAPEPIPGNLCGDVVCSEDQQCNEETKKCEPKEGPVGLQCENGEFNCNDTCVDLMSDKNNCGACGTVCEGDEVCSDGSCSATVVEKECEDEDAPICDGNAIKKCVDGKFVSEDCGDLSCVEGVCKSQDAEKECEDSMPPECDGNAVKQCVDGKFVTTECTGSLKCDSGECKEGVEAECEASEAPICVAELNAIRTCKDGRWDYENCGVQVCQESQCVDVVEKECEDDEAPVCEENGLKKCVDGKYVTDACGDGMICKEGSCVKTSLEDLCPDDENKKAPGVCGCGLADDDLDNNGTIDCLEAGDLCPDDKDKTLPGICGCNIPDTIDEKSGNPVCLDAGIDLCPTDEHKTLPGVCGCNVPDTIDELNRMPMCSGVSLADTPYRMCAKNDPKALLGVCGCLSEDSLDDKAGVPACSTAGEEYDLCMDDENKMRPGICGCGVEDSEENVKDSDGDGVADCIDACPANPYKFILDECPCEQVRVMLDGHRYCATPISTAAEFNNLRKDINDKKISNTVNDVYAIMKDINLIDIFPANNANEWVGFTGFKGKMVSAGKTISFKKGETLGTLNCAGGNCGLFNSLSEARIHNIKFEMNVNSKGGNSGLLAGSVSASNLSQISVKGNVTGTGANVGGMLGLASSTRLSNVVQEGDVTTTGNYAGGVVGRLQSGSVVSSVSAKGNVSGGAYTGGVFGSAESATLSALSSEGDVTGGSYTGGLIGQNTSSVTGGKVAAGKVHGKRYVGGAFGSSTGTLSDITNLADVSVDNGDGCNCYAGGIAGSASGNADHLINKGNVSSISKGCSDGNLTKEVGGIFGSGGSKISHAHNYGDVEGSANVGGISGRYGSTSIKDSSNHGKLNGGYWTGGIVGIYQTSGSTEFENLLNEGELHAGSSLGGIVGKAYFNGSKSKLTFKQVQNKGNVVGTSSGVGGIVGDLNCNGDCSFTDVYSDAEISGTNSVGGLIGQMVHSRTNSSSQTLTGEDGRILSQVIDRAYTKGKVTGNNNVGGAIGYIYTPINNVKVKAATTEKCPSDPSVNVSIPEIAVPMDVLNDVKITNVYSLSNVKGSSSIGGLIGNISCDNITLTGKIPEYQIEDCKAVNVGSKDYSAIRAGRISIANAYAGGMVTGVGKNVGGFIGTYAYTNNTLGTGTRFKDVGHNLNNIYATGIVSADGGALVGYRSLNTTYKNAYYWPMTANGSAAATSCAQCMSAESIPNMAGVSPFEFKAAVAKLKDQDVTLLDQLNSNIAASSASILNSNVSVSWVEIEHALNNASYKIPSLDIKPVNLEIEE